MLEVADDGCGIPEDVLPRIFDPFFTTKPVGQGTGLGLAISQRIVTNHGGRIDVESTPGRGSLFRVILPVDKEPCYQGP
jgi:signal transduction histidine kinase